MEKKLFNALTFVSLLAILSGGCSLLPLPGQAPADQASAADSTVCLVTDTQGIDDRSFNATAWKGVTDAQAQLGIEGAYLESPDDSYYDVNIEAFIQGGCDLIVTVGLLIGDATERAVQSHPDQKFAIVDYDFVDSSVDPPVDVSYPTVKELTFRADQGAFLAGYAAASATQTGIVGTFGGLDISTVTIFMDGYALGVDYYNQQHGTNVEVRGWDPVLRVGLFTKTFDDVQKGAEIAEQLIAEGADIIMPVAGGVGIGAAAIAQEHESIYIVGVDTDWTVSTPEYADIIFTSILKNMDVAVFNTIQDVLNGTFQGGLYIGTLENDGIDLAPFHQLDHLVSDEVKSELEQIKADIIAGNIQTQP
jgi:basic membrane protein A